MVTRVLLPAVLGSVLFLAACDHTTAVDKSGRLLTMAGQEAASISNTLDRFTRQLNVADTQLRTGRTADADKTLQLARDTLNGAKREEFDDLHRIAGWTAISQLAREAKDNDLALKSADLALAALNDVMPVTARPQYVLSLAGELASLRGNGAAVELLNSGGAWAAEFPQPDVRRAALVAFCQSLISYDAFDNARDMLRRDPDASWRTDTFLALANAYSVEGSPTSMVANDRVAMAPRAQGGGGLGGRGGGGAPVQAYQQFASERGNQSSPSPFVQKDLRFESNYKRQ